MADQLRPITLLLGATCLWALCLLVMGLAGLGSQVGPPSGAIAAPPLPKVALTRSQSRLGPFSSYAEVGQRPLLNQDRRPSLVAAAGEGSGDLDVVLTSVLITPTLQLAIFTDNKDASSRRARLGELVPGSNWRLAVLEPRRAVLEGPQGQRELGLRVFDGKGGQAPTPVPFATTAQPVRDGEAVNDANAAPPPPPAQPVPAPAPTAAAEPVRTQPKPDQSASAPMTQEQQVEAIRRRIEARRAQMRAEAAAAARDK